MVAAALYLHLSPKLPTVETLKEVNLQTPLRIYSQNLQLIGEFGDKRRTPISSEEIPEAFIHALLSAEDDEFYSHGGVDIKGLIRAATQLVTTGEIKTGGSTITMQLARNFFLTNRQTFTRKFNEILLALRIEHELTKAEILTLYANKIYLGNRAYGIEAAAQVYYGKSIGELSVAQLAMIAGLPKAPSAYNPIVNPERALIRRNWILQRMNKLGYLEDEAYQLAREEPISASYHGYQADVYAPYVAEMARQQAVQQYGDNAYTYGFQVITTIDSELQRAANNALQKGVLAYDQRHGYRGPEKQIENQNDWPEALKNAPSYGDLKPAIVTQVNDKSLDIVYADASTGTISWENGLKGLSKYISENRKSAPTTSAQKLFTKGDLIRVRVSQDSEPSLSQLPEAEAALVAINPENGAIQALVGGFDYYKSKFNRVTQAERQPGSNFKPFIYTTALENGFTPASIINDAPVVFKDSQLESMWRPENASGKFYGPTRLRKALYLSRNMVSIRLLRSLGIDQALQGLERFGFDPATMPRDLSLVLGSHATTPLKIVTGYATFANGGYRVEPFIIDEIKDSSGNLVYKASPLTVCRENCDDSDAANITSSEDSSEANASKPIALNSDAEPKDKQKGKQKDSQVLPIIDPERLPPPPNAPRVIDERTAYIINSMLKDVVRRGTATKAKELKRSDIAGKTGTTNGPRDAWFSGFNTDIVATAWVGFDENKLLGRGEYGGSAALPIWIDFMKVALSGKKEKFIPQPAGLVTVKINPVTGERARPGERDAIFEVFKKEDVPALTSKSNGGYFPQDDSVLPEDIF